MANKRRLFNLNFYDPADGSFVDNPAFLEGETSSDPFVIARALENRVTSYTKLASGTQGEQPAAGEARFRFNTTTGRPEFSDGTSWYVLNSEFANRYEFEIAFDSSTTIADPGSGDFRLDSSTLGDVDRIAISETDNVGKDISTLLAEVGPSDIIVIYEKATPANYIKLKGAVMSSSGGWSDGDFHLIYCSGTSIPFANTDVCGVIVIPGAATELGVDSSSGSSASLNVTGANWVNLHTTTLNSYEMGKGNSYVIQVGGYILNDSKGSRTYTFDVDIDGTSVYRDACGTLGSSATVFQPFSLRMVVHKKSNTTLVFGGKWSLNSGISNPTTGYGRLNTDELSADSAFASASSLTVAASPVITVRIQSDSTSTTQTLLRHYSIGEYFRAS